MFRHAPLAFGLVALLALSCEDKDTKEEESDEPHTPGTVSIPKDFQSKEALVAIRITNTTSTSSATHASLSRIFNFEIDTADLLMKGGAPKNAKGKAVPAGTGDDSTSSDAQLKKMLRGSSVEQARAVVERRQSGITTLFPTEDAVDACGNPQLAAFVTPEMLQYINPDVEHTDQPYWPSNCKNENCDTTTTGIWDVFLTEVRFDGMLDMVVQVYPNVKKQKPALWTHLYAYYLSLNHPAPVSDMQVIANVQKATLIMNGLLEVGKVYVDEKGFREVYKYPHTTRTMDGQDIQLTLESFTKCDKYWDKNFDGAVPFGCQGATRSWLLDLTTPLNVAFHRDFMNDGTDATYLQQVEDVFKYQLSTALACPTVEDGGWIQDGPVEIFFCPDGDLDLCIAEQDMEDFACTRLEEEALGDTGPMPPIEVEVDEIWTVGTQSEPFDILTPNQTFLYTVPGHNEELELELTAPLPSATADDVANALNAAETLRATLEGTAVFVTFSAGEPGSDEEGMVQLQPVADNGPEDDVTIGAGTLNSIIGFAPGQKAEWTIEPLDISQEAYFVSSLHGELGVAYVEIEADKETVVYVKPDEVDRIQAIVADDGSELSVPEELADTHCVEDGPSRINLDLPKGTYTLRIELDSTDEDPFWLMVTDAPTWIL